ncbi:hypothetical protein CMI47_20675 [Candidatus Pacearchaeota archaeon]|jgi:hypothetical protein|nr:hypothetical protein [Candidatus Pacearchaeota archaeon]|tara:strand:- start:4899 stop:5078 length:180 start_codon:yes stop_codon:yes gene_type:complete
MEEPENISQIKDKFFNGHTLSRDEINDLFDFLRELEALLDDGSNKKESSSGDGGFVKYG